MTVWKIFQSYFKKYEYQSVDQYDLWNTLEEVSLISLLKIKIDQLNNKNSRKLIWILDLLKRCQTGQNLKDFL